MTGGWRKLIHEKIRSSYSSPGVVSSIKLRSVRWAGHVARVMRNAPLFFL